MEFTHWAKARDFVVVSLHSWDQRPSRVSTLDRSSECSFRGVMGRVNNRTNASASGTAGKSENRRMSNADRSAYFARREAAKILRRVLEGDAQRRAVASIKSLVYAPSVRNKKGTFALVCKTLKCKFFPEMIFKLVLV